MEGFSLKAFANFMADVIHLSAILRLIIVDPQLLYRGELALFNGCQFIHFQPFMPNGSVMNIPLRHSVVAFVVECNQAGYSLLCSALKQTADIFRLVINNESSWVCRAIR